MDSTREVAAVKEGHPVKYSSMLNIPVCNNSMNFNPSSGDGGWCANFGQQNHWVQIDAPKEVFWNKIETKARGSWWVKNYNLKYSNDGATWNDYPGGTFTGNSDSTSIKANVLEEPINARMIRICPLTYSSHTAMQFEASYTQEYLIYTLYIYIYILQ